MGRSPCCEKTHTNKGAWTKEEDDRLVTYIRTYGKGCWRSLPKAAGLLRCGKSCRLRWINYLRPDLKRGNFTADEEELIIKLHKLLGNKWSLIAGRLPGRTDNEIKNYWNTHIRRKLLGRGIDPATHRPIHEPLTDVAASGNVAEEKPAVSAEKSGREELLLASLYQAQQQPPLPREQRCRDELNLDLCIGLPFHGQLQQRGRRSTLQAPKVGERRLCFSCSLGLQESEECRCRPPSWSQRGGDGFQKP